MATATAPKKLKLKMPVIETVPIEKIKPWENNPRLEHAVDRIAKSMEEFGYLSPVVVQKGSYRIIAGHGRYESLKKLNAAKIPVIVVDLTDEQADLYAVADNKIAESSAWDMTGLRSLMAEWESLNLDMDLTGFNADELQGVLSGPVVLPQSSPNNPPPGDPADAGSTTAPESGSPSPAGTSVVPHHGEKIEPAAPPSPVKTINLFFSNENYAEFVVLVEKLAARYGTKSMTETVIEAVRRQAKKKE